MRREKFRPCVRYILVANERSACHTQYLLSLSGTRGVKVYKLEEAFLVIAGAAVSCSMTLC